MENQALERELTPEELEEIAGGLSLGDFWDDTKKNLLGHVSPLCPVTVPNARGETIVIHDASPGLPTEDEGCKLPIASKYEND
ncbi:hypothetical protein [Synechococcus sp. PCC 6312]|uniref:hypothetical protein n=1 Tax=Synechococcus sp. (strain ATCC 27167 / PCC 6312) TaxID=195253 RepID=UPI00029EF279|nr:hypothetical protein [Synechococcus sp. PCC 6312]AFY60871.1 hypothetical protein Syn6312_1721 [Synechococcus sp. PCC 6312]